MIKRYFRSNIAALKTSVMGAPSQDWARQTDCLAYALKKFVLDVLLAAFLKKRIARLVTTEKRLQVLKVTHCFFFSVVLTFRSSFCVSAVVREVSFFQRLRGKEEWNGPREHLIWFCCYRHSSSDDTKTYSLIQNLVGFKPTISVCLVIGNHNLPKSAIFKT